MRRIEVILLAAAIGVGFAAPGALSHADTSASVAVGTEQRYVGANHLPIRVKVVGPVQAETDLQIICLFKHKQTGDTLLGALDDLDQKLGRAITALRDRGELAGDVGETLLIKPPPNSIAAKRLLIIGLGDEAKLSTDTLVRMGTTALRTAQALGAERVAVAPTIRDQGNSAMSTGDVATSVVKGIILAYDTQQKMQREGLSEPYSIQDLIFEAGQTYYPDVIAKMGKAVQDGNALVAARSSAPYRKETARP